jgi:hypothetical protein
LVGVVMEEGSPALDNHVASQLTTAKDRVRFLLEKYPATRGNDQYLCWLYLRQFAKLYLPFVEFEKFYEFSFETITRARRLIQEEAIRTGDNSLLPDNATILARRRKAESYRRVVNRV